MVSDRLKEVLAEYIKDNSSSFPYETVAELAIIYSTRMVDAYKRLFFGHFYEKFLKDLNYLGDEIFYKILWSMIASENLVIHEAGNDWQLVKDTIVKRQKELSAKTLCDLIVLSTKEQ